MCFGNTILMEKLEGKLPYSRWSLSAHKFSNSGDFHKIFGMDHQKGLVYFYNKIFLLQLLFFLEL